jgi:hypothetical protein
MIGRRNGGMCFNRGTHLQDLYQQNSKPEPPFSLYLSLSLIFSCKTEFRAQLIVTTFGLQKCSVPCISSTYVYTVVLEDGCAHRNQTGLTLRRVLLQSVVMKCS